MERSRKAYDLALLFAALSDRTRLRLLNLMDGREVCVCYFVEILGQSQPKISRHLAYLRRAGVVAARREGKWMHYKIVVPRTRRCSQNPSRNARGAQRREGNADGPGASRQSLLCSAESLRTGGGAIAACS